MSVQIHINGENAAEAVKELSSLASHFTLVPVTAAAITVAPAEAQQEEKPKRQRAAKQADTESKPVGVEVGQPEAVKQDSESEKESQTPEPPKEEPAPPASDIPDIVDLRARAQEIGKTDAGKKAIKALLDKFGSKSLSDLPEEKRADFMDELALL